MTAEQIPSIEQSNPNFLNRLKQMTIDIKETTGKLALVGSVFLGSTVAAFGIEEVADPRPALADTTPVTVGMPFEGMWAYSNLTKAGCGSASTETSHPSCHEVSTGDWSTDLYAAAGTEVKLRVDGEGVSLAWDTASGTCGETRRVKVSRNGVYVGRVSFTHLSGAVSTDTAPTNGIKVGTVANLSCNPGGSGKHIHAEFDNADASTYSCYINHSNAEHTAGMTLSEGVNLGVLGSPNTGEKQPCASLPSAAPTQPQPDAPNLPKGDIMELRRTPQGIYLRGWAADTDTTGPIPVHLYGGTGEAVSSNLLSGVWADQPIPENIHPYNLGNNHGFSLVVPYPYGQHRICAYGLNAGPGSNRRFDCVDTVVSPDAFGVLDEVRRVPGGIEALGWTLDPDTMNPTEVHVYGGNGTPTAANPLRGTGANLNRPDIATAFPGYGSNHGFKLFMPVGTETSSVCAYPLNATGTPGSGSAAGCKAITISPNPYGNFEAITRVPGGINVSGWAIDPDTMNPIQIHAYAGNGAAIPNNPMAGTTANGNRPDVGNANPGYGPNHGFSLFIPTGTAPQTVCTYAINDVAGQLSPGLGCRGV